jgi:UDP-N-acetyl-2-amino-2-deoxyglucuronate dehydrogenase
VPVGEAIANSPLTSLARVHDLDERLARDLAARCGVPYTTRLDDILRDPGIDAVYIAVPHDMLARLAEAALCAGKHVLVEKPMAITLEDADKLIALAESHHLALGVFYEMRYAAAFAQARELIQAGAIGGITGVHIQTLIDKPMAYWSEGYSGRSRNSWRGEKARAGGGVLLMNTSHLLDAVRFVTGLEVESVTGQVETLSAEVEVEDSAVATLRYTNGALASLFAGAHVAGAHGDERFDIYGAKGSLRVGDPYRDQPVTIFMRRDWSDFPAGEWRTLPQTRVNVFRKAIEEFVAAVQNGTRPPIDGRDARQVLEIVLAIYRSAEEKRQVTLVKQQELPLTQLAKSNGGS